jgi:hypothetical protein
VAGIPGTGGRLRVESPARFTRNGWVSTRSDQRGSVQRSGGERSADAYRGSVHRFRQRAELQREQAQQHPGLTLFDPFLAPLLDALLNEPLRKPCHLCHLLGIALAVDDAFILVQRRVDVDEIQILEPPLRVGFQLGQAANGLA